MQPLVRLDRPVNEVAILTLNRVEKKNALSIELRDVVSHELELLGDDAATKCVILTGGQGIFSAGFDLAEFAVAATDSAFHDRIWSSSDRYHKALLNFPKPLIAAVSGPALGGGMDTAVLCDIRLAAADARFGHPEVKFGDVVYAPLHDLIGGGAARELCLTGRVIDAVEALRIGLVSEVVPAGALADRVLDLARGIAQAPYDVLRRTKAKIIARAAIDFETTLKL